MIWEANIAPNRRYDKYFTSLIKKGVQVGSLVDVDPAPASQMTISTAMALYYRSCSTPKAQNGIEVARDSTNLLK